MLLVARALGWRGRIASTIAIQRLAESQLVIVIEQFEFSADSILGLTGIGEAYPWINRDG